MQAWGSPSARLDPAHIPLPPFMACQSAGQVQEAPTPLDHFLGEEPIAVEGVN